MTKISDELKARILRKSVHEDKYGIVGVEIKNRRQSSSQTLEAVAVNVCSLSYLCKIEKNAIEPNKAFLREICSRLDLSDDKVDFLFELRDVLIRVVHSFLFNENDLIELAYEHGIGFQNYRFSIIEMINYITKKDIDKAYKILLDLMPLISNMTEFDLTIYSVFSGIVFYHKGEFQNAYDDLSSVGKFELLDDLRIIKDIYLLKIAFGMNRADTPRYFEIISRELYLSGYYSLIDEIKYIIGLYYVKNDCDVSFKETLKMIENRVSKKSLECLYDFYNDNSSLLLETKDDELNDFARCIKHIYLGDANDIIEKYDTGYYCCEFDVILAKYLTIRVARDRIDYIFKVGLPKASTYDDGYLKKFFLKEVATLPAHINKNKSLLKGFVMAYGVTCSFSDIDIEDDAYDEKND